MYSAEDAVESSIGPSLRRWKAVEAFAQSILDDERTRDTFGVLPSEITLLRRSRSATASLAVPATTTIAIRDGSWSPLVVIHELAHLIAFDDGDHGPQFAGIELWLVRRHCGFESYLALADQFDIHKVDYRSYPWDV